MISNSLEDTKKMADDFVNILKKMDKKIDKKYVDIKNCALVIGFSGDLGSGKTAFTQLISKILNIKESVTSPTFVIQKNYKINLTNFPFKKLIHIDAYRLESGSELLTLGFADLLSDPSNLIIIEWPKRVMDILPKDTKIIKFSHINETSRSIDFPAMMKE